VGLIFGLSWFTFKPINGFVSRKLMGSVGDRAWSGRQIRFLKSALSPYVAGGASVMLGYNFILEFMRYHHETNNDRPLVIDHFVATTVITTFAGFLISGTPRALMQGFVLGTLLIAPMSWWAYVEGRNNAKGRSSNIFYLNGTS
jgi:hypothetical protein